MIFNEQLKLTQFHLRNNKLTNLHINNLGVNVHLEFRHKQTEIYYKYHLSPSTYS